MLCFTEGLFIVHMKDLMQMMMIGNEHLNCVQTVSCKLTIENDDNRKLWGVMVLHGCMVNWQGRCNGVAWIYGQLTGGQSVIGPCYTITPPLSIDHRSMQHHYTP